MGPAQSAVLAYRGRVVSGRGQAASEFAALRVELEALSTEPFYPGSVNLVLDRPLRLRAGRAFVFDNGQRMLWPAVLNRVDVWIYRWSSCPLHIVEVLSPIHLRRRLQLSDGEGVTLEVSAAEIARVSCVERLVWGAFWLGRIRWTYSFAPYFACVEDLAQRLGAAQQKPGTGAGTRLIARALGMLHLRRGG
jgi:hypothetical protein